LKKKITTNAILKIESKRARTHAMLTQAHKETNVHSQHDFRHRSKFELTLKNCSDTSFNNSFTIDETPLYIYKHLSGGLNNY